MMFMVSNLFAEDQLGCMESTMRGKVDASIQHDSSYFIAGVGISILLNLPGTGVVIAFAATSDSYPAHIPEDEIIDPYCYISGYTKEARKKDVLNALGGGLIGTVISTAIISLIVISVNSGS